MKKAIVAQILILVAAWYFMTPDILKDNTWVFGLIGDVEVVRGNGIWVMSIAAVLSAINIWVWWPKAAAKQTVEKPIADETKSETKAEDPIVPKMD